MLFTCEKTTLLKEISFAQDIIATKNAISILSNVLLTVSNNTLTITATDIKVHFQTSIPVNSKTNGSVTVFCDKLLAILTSLPDGEIEFSQDDNKVSILPKGEKKKIHFQLKSITSDKFPEIPNVPEEGFFEISVTSMKKMISQTVFAISDDETRYFMNGVFLECDAGKITMVATDGRRLAFISKKEIAEGVSFKGVIVPPKVLEIINKKAGDQGLMSIAVTEKNIFIQFGNYKISSVLIEAQFPNYQRVIPEKQAHTISVNKKDLYEALRRVSILIENKSRKVLFNLSSGLISLLSEESEIGVAKEEVACNYEGPDVTIIMNYRYIEEPLRVIDTENVDILFSEPQKAMTLQPSPESDYFHVIMPMQ